MNGDALGGNEPSGLRSVLSPGGPPPPVVVEHDDAIIAGVRDVHEAVLVDRDTHRTAQHGGLGGRIQLGERLALARQHADHAGIRVGDEDSAIRPDRHAVRVVQSRDLGEEAAEARRVGRPGRRGSIRHRQHHDHDKCEPDEAGEGGSSAMKGR